MSAEVSASACAPQEHFQLAPLQVKWLRWSLKKNVGRNKATGGVSCTSHCTTRFSCTQCLLLAAVSGGGRRRVPTLQLRVKRDRAGEVLGPAPKRKHYEEEPHMYHGPGRVPSSGATEISEAQSLSSQSDCTGCWGSHPARNFRRSSGWFSSQGAGRRWHREEDVSKEGWELPGGGKNFATQDIAHAKAW